MFALVVRMSLWRRIFHVNENLKALIMNKGLHKFISSDCQARMEMLADSIIKECIGISEEAVDHREPASTYADKIRQHFGVDK